MATNSTDSSSKKAPRIHRFYIGVNVLTQIVIIFFIFAAVNYIAFKHFKRWDFSRDQKYSLSEQTKQLLANLQKPLKVYVFFSPDPRLPGGDVYQDVQNLLKEYQYAAPHGKVDVEVVDPYRSLSRAKELMAQYKFGNENVVIVDYDGRSKVVSATDMADYDTSGEMEGQPPTLKDFKGEQALTAAIIEVSEEKQNTIYLVAGKGGPELSDDQLAALKTYLERENLKLESLTLMDSEKVPADAKALMLIGAKYDLTDRELQMLHDYWDAQGRLFIALDPSGHTPKLDSFLAGAGVAPQDDRVLRTMALGPMTGIVRDVAGSFSETSPVTKRLKGVDTMFMGQTQSLKVMQPVGANVDPLVTAAEGYWGETKYQNMETTGVSYDPKEDISAPLTIAASLEKGALPDQSVQVDTSRLVVTGNSTFLTSEALTEANVDFVLSSLNWLLNRKELIGIAPKVQQQFTLNLAGDALQRIELLVMVVMPLGVAMLGTIVWAQRRR